MLKEKIEIIQVLRFVAATSVMLYHFTFGVFKDKGYFGVEIFFVISGFLMVYSTEKYTNNNITIFLVKRIKRIIPLYWIATISMYFMISIYPSLSIMSEPKIIYLIKSLFFIPFVNEKGYNYPILSIGWTLNYEVYFYIIFVMAMKFSYKYRAELCMLFGIILMGIGVLVPINNVCFDFLTSPFLLEFIFGIIVYKIYQKFRFIDKNESKVISNGGGRYICLILSILLFTNYLVKLFPFVHRCITIGIPASMLFMICILCWGKTQMPKTLVTLGNISYSIYIVEFFSTKFFKLLIQYIDSVSLKYIILVIVCLITYLVSYGVYVIIEKHVWINKIIMNFFKKKQR